MVGGALQAQPRRGPAARRRPQGARTGRSRFACTPAKRATLLATCAAAVCCGAGPVVRCFAAAAARAAQTSASQPLPRGQGLKSLARQGIPGEHESPPRVTINADGSVRLYNPDMETIGRLRGLGRCLFIAGEKLVDASAEMTGRLGGTFKLGEANVQACGTSLRDAAGALLQERWAEADYLIGAARLQCGTFLPNEHLAALQAVLSDSSRALPGAGEALKALSSVLELHAERPALDPEWPTEACIALQDMLVEAAGALRAAARLFATPATRPCSSAAARAEAAADRARRAASRYAMGAVAAAAMKAGLTPASAREIEETVMQAPEGDVQSALRSLAKKYHPDRFPGQEMEVLPVFLYVQRLREDRGRHWLGGL